MDMAAAILTFALAADLFLPVAGNLRAASGREFRTVVWITNLAERPARVRITFLERHPLSAAPRPMTVDLAAGQTIEVDDVPLRLGRPGVVGALHFESDVRVAVTARIFSPDAIGEGLNAVSADAGLNHGDEGVITGVQLDSSAGVRETTYLIEMSGRPAGVLVTLRDANGRPIAHDNLLLEAYEHRTLRIAEFARANLVRNGSIAVRVTGGSGSVYALGLQIPSPTGDGYFVRMAIVRARDRSMSPAEIAVWSLTALAVIFAIGFDLYTRKRTNRG